MVERRRMVVGRIGRIERRRLFRRWRFVRWRWRVGELVT
jgi:hypothetical protein